MLMSLLLHTYFFLKATGYISIWNNYFYWLHHFFHKKAIEYYKFEIRFKLVADGTFFNTLYTGTFNWNVVRYFILLHVTGTLRHDCFEYTCGYTLLSLKLHWLGVCSCLKGIRFCAERPDGDPYGSIIRLLDGGAVVEKLGLGVGLVTYLSSSEAALLISNSSANTPWRAVAAFRFSA